MTPERPKKFKVKGSKIKVIEWHDVLAWNNRHISWTDSWTEFKLCANYHTQHSATLVERIREKSCKLWYKHQIWHSDSHGYTNKIHPMGQLKIQDGGHFSRWPPNWRAENPFHPRNACIWSISIILMSISMFSGMVNSFLPCDCEAYERSCYWHSVCLSVRPSVCQTRVLWQNEIIVCKYVLTIQ